MRVTGDAEMAAMRDWFDALWKESEDISGALVDVVRSVMGLSQDTAVSHPPSETRTQDRSRPSGITFLLQFALPWRF